MKRRGQRNVGFTIVELLVVIVVIAVITAIVVVSYSGAQQRARDTKTATDVKRYKNALEAYNTIKGSYPTVAGSASVCLGEGYPSGKCWLANVDENSAFMAALKPYGDNLPKLEQGVILRGGIFSPAARGNKLDGVNTNFVAYIVANNSKCPLGPVVTYSSGQLFTSAVPESGQSTGPNANGDVQCWVALED